MKEVLSVSVSPRRVIREDLGLAGLEVDSLKPDRITQSQRDTE